jgi:hypothetical protein
VSAVDLAGNRGQTTTGPLRVLKGKKPRRPPRDDDPETPSEPSEPPVEPPPSKSRR